jgi:hypothetical protein
MVPVMLVAGAAARRQCRSGRREEKGDKTAITRSCSAGVNAALVAPGSWRAGKRRAARITDQAGTDVEP